MSIESVTPDKLITTNQMTKGSGQKKTLTIALAGNANVGKSAIFNQLTGLTHEVGNWAGKTVEIKEGTLVHHGITINIVDLPGIYSFSAYSPEEMATREYILTRHPDTVINVLDATTLERNLYFTLQLKEMNVPLVVALNYADIAKKRHIHTDLTLLGQILRAPVINTVAIKGIGVHELVDGALDSIERNALPEQDNKTLRYGLEIENRIIQLQDTFKGFHLEYPPRWAAIKLLESDKEIIARLEKQAPASLNLAEKLSLEIARIHGENSSAVMAAERYALAARIAQQASTFSEVKPRRGNHLDNLTLHPIAGYLVFLATMVAILVFISFFGGWITNLITRLFNTLNPNWLEPFSAIFWNGAVTGAYAALAVALGFILPFFLILSWLAESGYLPRIAFMMDRPLHLIGLHGQASLPLLMALGCNVPACLSCRIIENRRDRIIAMFLSTMVPCSARTSVILGLVGAFIGWYWAVSLLIFQFVLIFILGWVLCRLAPSSSPGIIMEIPEYRIPDLKIVWRQAWHRFRDFLIIGVPFIVVGSMVIETLRVFNLLDVITQAMSPLTVGWLGLPAFTGVLLIFGVLRKEANLVLLISLAGGAAITSIISPLQMVVFSIVILLYIPCISTIAVMIKETSIKTTAAMVFAEIALALLVGGAAYRALGLFMH